MKKLIILFAILVSMDAFGKGSLKKDILRARDLSVKILTQIEKKTRYPRELQKFSYLNLNSIQYSFIGQVFARGVDGKCFFGGWMSVQESLCRVPWRHKNNDEIKSFGPTYDSSVACGAKDLFRCNTTLFGTPASPNPAYGNNPQNGICIKITNYNNVTKQCAQEASKYEDEFADGLLKDEQKFEEFKNHLQAVMRYCRQDNLDYCDELQIYLEKVLRLYVDKKKALACEENEGVVEEAAPLSLENQTNLEELEEASADAALEEAGVSTDAVVSAPEQSAVGAPAPGGPHNFPLTPRIMLLSHRERAQEMGYYWYRPARFKFGTERTIWRLREIGKRLADKDMIMAVGDISARSGSTPGHSEHQEGQDVDFRLISPSGISRQCNVSNSTCYSREKTLEFLKVVIDVDPERIEKLYVDDRLLREQVTQYYHEKMESLGLEPRPRFARTVSDSDHSRHIHVSWK